MERITEENVIDIITTANKLKKTVIFKRSIWFIIEHYENLKTQLGGLPQPILLEILDAQRNTVRYIKNYKIIFFFFFNLILLRVEPMEIPSNNLAENLGRLLADKVETDLQIVIGEDKIGNFLFFFIFF